MAVNPAFIQRIGARAEMGRQGLRRKPPNWLPPDGVERRYRKLLMLIAAEVEQGARERVLPAVEAAYRRMQSQFTRTDRDDPEDVQRVVDEFNAAMAAVVVGQPIVNELETIAREISQFNRAQFRKIIQATLGVDVFQGEPWLVDVLKSFEAENLQLIRSLPQQQIDKISGIAQRGLRSGAGYSEIADEIMAKAGVQSRQRAELIARDQVSKLNGQLTKYRQQEIGVAEYTWRTARDERVRGNPTGRYPRARPRHDTLDGMICKWSDPTVYREPGSDVWKKRSSIGATNAHPGQDIQCRCHGAANLDKLFEDAGI